MRREVAASVRRLHAVVLRAGSTPQRVALIVFSASLCFCVLRALAVGGPGHWPVIGDDFADLAALPGGVAAIEGPGFDGAFYYRQALDPFNFQPEPSNGIAFDVAVRPGRIGYPLLAWALSFGGTAPLVPFALVAVNVVAITVVGLLGAVLATHRGRHAAWGLVIAGYWGFGIVLARDLAELVAVASVLAALFFVAEQRHLPAAAAATLAVLTREQELVMVAAIAAGVAIAAARERGALEGVRQAIVLAGTPLLVFGAWQGWIVHATGVEPPVNSALRLNGGTPFAGLLAALPVWIRDFGTGVGSSLAVLCLVALATVLGWGLSTGARAAWQAAPWELMALVAGLAIFVTLDWNVLYAPADFRQLGDAAALAWLVGLRSTASGVVPVAVWLPVAAVAFGFRALTL